jgi:glycosyltransferase involved in cell wall biosynthesis
VDGGGLLVDPRDHAAFVDAVRTLLQDAGRAARARAAATRFDWDASAAATLDVYRRVLHG